jgi:hypothetical protein
MHSDGAFLESGRGLYVLEGMFVNTCMAERGVILIGAVRAGVKRSLKLEV